MQIVLNEFSLDGKLAKVDDFFEKLIKLIKIQRVMDQCALTLLKHYELYNTKVTTDHTLHDILTSGEYRTRTEIRRFKTLIDRLINNPPFWNDDQKHNLNDVYTCEFTTKTYDYSLAEACERDKWIISFEHNHFLKLTYEIYKNGTPITLFNLHNHIDMIELLHENNIVNDLEYCKVMFEGTKLSFELLEDGYGFEDMEDREVSAFISSFKLFATMEWNDIIQYDGFDYKMYSPSRSRDWFKSSKHADRSIYKFRASQRYRCFGYRDNDRFYVLRLETDHKNSDHG